MTIQYRTMAIQYRSMAGSAEWEGRMGHDPPYFKVCILLLQHG